MVLLNRKLTLKEIDTVTRHEVAEVKASDDLTQEELQEFEIIIRAEMLYWTLEQYLLYMSRYKKEEECS